MPGSMLSLHHRPLPEPPEMLRQGPTREGAFTSPLHSRYNAAWLGYALGWSFLVCFVTGLISHWAQQPPSWFVLPTRPVWVYRLTQGTHIATGLACIPLLLAKLWVVYPKFWEWPPIRSVAHALEKLSILALVGGALLQLLTGLANVYQWYFFRFFFTPTHYFTAWLVMGSLLIHIGTKIALARDALRHPERDADPEPRPRSTALTLSFLEPVAPPSRRPQSTDPEPDDVVRPGPVGTGAVWPAAAVVTTPAARVLAVEKPTAPEPEMAPDGLSRRWFLATVGAAAGAVTITTVGQSVPVLRNVALLAPRRVGGGGSRVPINKTANAAGISFDPAAYRLQITGAVPAPYDIDLDELESLARRSAWLPMTCVEGWSVQAHWRGVRLRDLVARAGGHPRAAVRVESLERGGLYRSSVVPAGHTASPLTLLATHLDGARLSPDHGYPVRLIAPNRPGVQQTKWVQRVVVL